MSNHLRQTSHNCRLAYTINGTTHTAKVRVSEIGYTYSVVSTESHARNFRSFYPHRRALGNFVLTIDCKNYHEFNVLMKWLRQYATHLLASAMGNTKGSVIMEVSMPSRHFHKTGVMVGGISDMDNTAKMVWSPQLTFMTVQDFHDPGTSIVQVNQTSQFHAPGNPHVYGRTTDHVPAWKAFFPASSSEAIQANLYDGGVTVPPPATGEGSGGSGGVNKRI